MLTLYGVTFSKNKQKRHKSLQLITIARKIHEQHSISDTNQHEHKKQGYVYAKKYKKTSTTIRLVQSQGRDLKVNISNDKGQNQGQTTKNTVQNQ